MERQLERRLERAAHQLQGSLEADALQAELARLRREWREPAKAEVKDQLLVDAVARARNIEVSDADIAQRVEAMSGRTGLVGTAFGKLLAEVEASADGQTIVEHRSPSGEVKILDRTLKGGQVLQHP